MLKLWVYNGYLMWKKALGVITAWLYVLEMYSIYRVNIKLHGYTKFRAIYVQTYCNFRIWCLWIRTAMMEKVATIIKIDCLERIIGDLNEDYKF